MSVTRRTALAAAAAALVARPAIARSFGRTPLGGVTSADGPIPSWTGEAPNAQGGFDPFAADPVLETIGATRADDKRLPEGLAALLRARPGRTIRLMPTRRTAAVPDFVLRATETNAGRAMLTDDGRSIKRAAVGIPFRAPANGLEAIWNHMLRWRFVRLSRTVAGAAPLASGLFTLQRYADSTIYPYNDPAQDPADPQRTSQLLRYVFLKPAALARTALMSSQPLDFAREATNYWFWYPSERRVVSTIAAFDLPNGFFEGLRLVDDADVFSGSPERYEWRLHGQRAFILPYNSFALCDPARRYSEVLQPGGLNDALTRYELRRVWIVEARLKKGASHRFPRRVFYLDEDSWQALLAEHYDAGGRLARVTEAHPIQYRDPLSFYASVDVVHDLASGRYAVFGLPNEEPPIDTRPNLTVADFSAGAFRAAVAR